MHSSSKLLLLDLDDTLCDLREGFRQAVNSTFSVNIDACDPIIDLIRSANDSLFYQYKCGNIALEGFRMARFKKIVSILGFERIDQIRHASSNFTNLLNHSCKLYGDAVPFLEMSRRSGYRLGLITNGPSDGQRAKLSALSISSYFDVVLISGEVGCAKPSEQIFLLALMAENVEPFDTIMIGDNYENDCQPAINIGIRSVLLDRKGLIGSEIHGGADVVRNLGEIDI